MKNKKLISFAQSFILLPFITTSLPIAGPTLGGTDLVEGGVTVAQTVLLEQINIADGIFAGNKVEDPKVAEFQAKAEAIDAYFTERDMPLAGFGLKMAEAADKHGLDWRIVAAIAVRESTGGKFACKGATYNSFGWGSCKIDFDSNAEAIETVARNLGGNNPNTAHHYDNKTTVQILRAYNPPSIVKHYAEQVISIMNAIGPEDITSPMNMEKSAT